MKWRWAVLLSVAPLVWAEEAVVVTKESVGTFYRGFKRLTNEPRSVEAAFVDLCDLSGIEKALGPHARTWIHYYANPEAVQSMAAKAVEFPVGAVIVKEKLRRDGVVTGIGGMVKRAKGYDPTNGDWEFFYSTPGKAFSSGKLGSCIDCHKGGKRDHVFSAWSL
jgi:hypothetical protein